MGQGTVTELVGREREGAQLGLAVEEVAGGEVRVVALIGEAGIGKSAMLEDVARTAEDAGLLVLGGRAAEHESDLPFGLVADALDDHVSTLHPRRLESLGAEREAELAAVLPAVAQHVPPAEPAGPGERIRYHRALRALIELLARERPLALLLDDVHWADAASLELILHLIRRPPRAPHLLVVATRPVEPSPRILDALRGARAAAHVALSPLAPAAAEQLLAGVADDRRRAQLVDEAGGNPLFLTELARTAGEPDAPLPPTLIAAVQQEVAGLPPASRALLDGAAVAGDPFDPELAATAAGLDDDALVPLDRLVAADLVAPTGTARGFRFRHPLVRRAVYDAAPPAWRLSAHERVAGDLAARAAPAAVRAFHLEQSARPGDEEAIGVLVAAAGEAAETAPGTAAHWYEAALRLLAGADDAQRAGLMIPLGATLAAAGRLHDAQRVFDEAVRITPDDAGRPLLVAMCALMENLLGRHTDSRLRLEAEIARLDYEPDDQRLLPLQLALAASVSFPQDAAAMREWSARALETAGEPEPGSEVMGAVAIAHGLGSVGALWEGEPARAGELADRGLELWNAMPDSAIAAWPNSVWGLGYSLLLLDRHLDAEPVFRRGVRVIREAHLGHMLAVVETLLGMTLYGLLRLDEAEEVVETAVERSRLGGLNYQLQWALCIHGSIAAARGDRAEVRRIDAECRPLVEVLEHDDLFRATALCNLAANYAHEEPERAIREMVDAAGPSLERLDASWPTWLLVVMIRSAIALDRLEDAERWAALIEERAAVYELPIGHERARVGRAEVLLARGDAAAAIPLAREAIAGAEERGYLLDAMPARLLLGRALAAAGEAKQAENEIREVAARAEQHGAFAFREAAAAELRQLGVRLRGATRSRGGSSDELTDREREIAALVAEGSSNKQVAAALYLSEKTIEHHLSRVYSKLGVRSRTELAAAWQAT